MLRLIRLLCLPVRLATRHFLFTLPWCLLLLFHDLFSQIAGATSLPCHRYFGSKCCTAPSHAELLALFPLERLVGTSTSTISVALLEPVSLSSSSRNSARLPPATSSKIESPPALKLAKPTVARHRASPGPRPSYALEPSRMALKTPRSKKAFAKSMAGETCTTLLVAPEFPTLGSTVSSARAILAHPCLFLP